VPVTNPARAEPSRSESPGLPWRRVRVVGAGLIGTSVGLALRAHAVLVVLDDLSPRARALAREVGAGDIDTHDLDCDLVIVASPPDATADIVARELQLIRWPP
jgi:prephenate dehydrogenase